MTIETKQTNQRSALFAIAALEQGERHEERERSLIELVKLAGGLGYPIVDRMIARRRDSARLFGDGKLDELRERVEAAAQEIAEERTERELILIVDDALDPSTQYQLERALGVPVWDRAGLILRIFEARATTRLAAVEVELARLAYDAPRLRSLVADDDREGGGGRGGRGDTNLDLARQAVRDRRVALERELERLRETRATQRAQRQALPQVALVGYTNAGKSSLLRALTGSEVYIEDALFATLEATVRILQPKTTPKILVSDTVGFIRRLPHELVASFRSTLEEAREADLLLHVLDASDPEFAEHRAVTEETLEAIEAEADALLIFNKIDRLSEGELGELRAAHPEAIFLSAQDADSVGALHAEIVRYFRERFVEEELAIPFSEPKLLADIRGRAEIVSEDYDEEGARLVIRASAADMGAFKKQLGLLPDEDELLEDWER